MKRDKRHNLYARIYPAEYAKIIVENFGIDSEAGNYYISSLNEHKHL